MFAVCVCAGWVAGGEPVHMCVRVGVCVSAKGMRARKKMWAVPASQRNVWVELQPKTSSLTDMLSLKGAETHMQDCSSPLPIYTLFLFLCF